MGPGAGPAGGGVDGGSRGAHGAHNLTCQTDLATSLAFAESLGAKFMGLMGRAVLPEGTGLWLPDSNGIHMMFMRFPIDAVFVGRPATGRGGGARPVVSLHRALRPWVGLVPLVRGAHGVLELPAGTIDATGTQVGDLILIA
ncbi:DUF192 domain-containing protein [soil metagenome]